MDAPKLSEKVLKDKRKKLKETFQRVLKLYVSNLSKTHFESCNCWYTNCINVLYYDFFQEKENPDLAKDLLKQELEYDRKREKLQVFYGKYRQYCFLVDFSFNGDTVFNAWLTKKVTSIRSVYCVFIFVLRYFDLHYNMYCSIFFPQDFNALSSYFIDFYVE